MTPTIGFIGLGHMGRPMAANLLKAGYALRTYESTSAAETGAALHRPDRVLVKGDPL